MKEIYQKYLAALRSFVQGTAPEPLTGEELKRVMELAMINSTAGILQYMTRLWPEMVEPEFREPMRRMGFTEIARNTQRMEMAKGLTEELDRLGIDFILFKGFVVRTYYPVPELRTFNDVDIVIRREDRQKSDERMLALGYERKDDWEPSYSYLKGREFYELHSRVIGFDVSDKADFVGYFGRIWDHTRPAEAVALEHARELEPEFHFLYLLAHIAKHISRSGAGVRMYLDLAFFIRHFGESLNWAWVAGELKTLNLTDFASVALAAVEDWFGVASPLKGKAVSREILDDFMEFTVSGGIYGYVGRDKGELFLKQQNRNGEEVSRLYTLLHHAFPPGEILVNKYTYLEKRPWLLPAAWGQRLLDSRKEWGRFLDSTKQILSADEEKVLKLKRLYKEIGL